MKKHLWWIVPLAVVVAVEAQTGKREKVQLPARFNHVYEWRNYPSRSNLHRIRVVTWNIHHGSELDAITHSLERDAADLLLLQEVDWNTKRAGNRDVARELGRRLRRNGGFGTEFEELSQSKNGTAFTGQATLSDLPIVRWRVLRFERQSGFWKPHAWIPAAIPLMQRRIGNRMALVTELEFAGRPLIVYNAHLESRSAGFVQMQQIEELLADAKQYPAEAVVVLGGDLNTKYLPSKFLHRLEAAGFRSALGERIERTHRITFALDWIFVKGARVTDGTVERAAKGSDHYPVYATLEPAA